jgi:hypothetical protein
MLAMPCPRPPAATRRRLPVGVRSKPPCAQAETKAWLNQIANDLHDLAERMRPPPLPPAAYCHQKSMESFEWKFLVSASASSGS